MLAIEAEVAAAPSKRELHRLRLELQAIAGTHPADQEIQSAAARVQSQIDTALAQPEPSPIPWKVVGAAAAGAALVIAGVLAIPRLFHKQPRPPVLVALEIRTDPEGATVTMGDRTCVSPNCKFDLKPGQYQLQAQRDGFEPQTRTVILDPGKTPSTVDLTLKAIPPPPPPPGAKTGTLLVHAGQPQARVIVDGRDAGRTDTKGDFSTTLEAVPHEIRVEKDRFQPAPSQHVTITEDTERPVRFNLLPKDAHLQLTGAPSAVEIRVDGKLVSHTDGSSPFVLPIKPGQHTLQIMAWQRSHDFGPDDRLPVEWKEIAPPSITTKQPTDAELEEQAWNQVSTSSDPDKVRQFLLGHPNGAHSKPAQELLETLEWNRTDRNKIEALEAFRRNFPNSPHAREAEDQIARLKTLPVNPEPGGKKGPVVEPPKPEPKRPTDDTLARQQAETDIRAVIAKFNTAQKRGQRGKGELLQIWPSGKGSSLIDMLGTQTAELQESGPIVISGDRATVRCNLLTVVRQRPGTNQLPVTVTFERRAAQWSIQSLLAVQ